MAKFHLLSGHKSFIAKSSWIKSIPILSLLFVFRRVKLFESVMHLDLKTFLNSFCPSRGILIHLEHKFIVFFSLPSLWMQRPRQTVPIQHGTVQAFRSRIRRSLYRMSACNDRTKLPLLQGGILQGSYQAARTPKGMQTWVISIKYRSWWNVWGCDKNKIISQQAT